MRENDHVFLDERDGVNNSPRNLRRLDGRDRLIDYTDLLKRRVYKNIFVQKQSNEGYNIYEHFLYFPSLLENKMTSS